MLITTLLVCLLAACTQREDVLLQISAPYLTMCPGEQYRLSTNGTGPVHWSTADSKVARVEDGLITAVAVGQTTITATVGEQSVQCYVTVKENASDENRSFEWITPRYLNLERGDTIQLRCGNPTSETLVWLSSNEMCATVSETGLVTALAPGHAEIEVYAGARRLTAYVAVAHHWSDYHLVWADEFEGTDLDRSTWNIEIDGNGGGNQELQYYTDRHGNLRVENGCLIIEARKENYAGRQYTSARINTLGKREFRYGKIEARIAFPAGGGTWPAFWMMGGNWREIGWPGCGELDIIEHVGNQPRMLSFAYHTVMQNGMKGTHWSTTRDYDNVEQQFHTYGIEWLEEEHQGCDRIVFFYDGEPQAMVQEDLLHIDDYCYWPFNRDCFLILNLAIGGNMGGPVDNRIFQSEVKMLVDWVRVYQRSEMTE